MLFKLKEYGAYDSTSYKLIGQSIKLLGYYERNINTS